MSTYAGIDYGHGLTNKDHEKGIRYGVIHQNAVLQSWADSSEPFYPNVCPICGNEPKSGKNIRDMKRCPSCRKTLNDFSFDMCEPTTWFIKDDEYFAHSDDYGDIFIERSPYYTFAQFCSPCAPGACHLENPLDEPSPDNRAYCFGHDFFEEGKAPYRVFSVETNEEIFPIPDSPILA